MNINNKFIQSFCNFVLIPRRATSKIVVQLNEDLQRQLEDGEIKARKHPGTFKKGDLSVPSHIVHAITRSVREYPIKNLIRDGLRLNRYFRARHLPAESGYLREKKSEIQSEVSVKFPIIDPEEKSEEEIDDIRNKRSTLAQKLLKQRVFAWKPMEYGAYEAIVYAVGCSSQEYACILKIFKEIENRDSAFKPRSFFDFGSGIGSAMWAASALWQDTIFEYFNVDSSRDMNELSDLILRDGVENKQPSLKNVYYRQFLPAADVKYDLVVSAFSLLELPNQKSRLEVLKNLWIKCDRYLVLIEIGTRVGFQLINEARDFILSLNETGHIFSPCPHDLNCPRISEDNTPCNFEATYTPLPLGGNYSTRKYHYSYVVFKKGERDSNMMAEGQWPRLVRPTMVRSKHSICRMCTSEGKLQEIIFTASKHGKLAYRCARSSRWGDRLPIRIGENFEKVEE